MNNTSNQPVFRGFAIEDPSNISGYQRNLPHLRIEGATYFVTFRLADSIPKATALRWKEERELWLKSNGVDTTLPESHIEWKKSYFSIPFQERRTFEQKMQRRFLIELDKCHGNCLLKHTHNIVANALDFFHGQRVWCGDYVVMPNHVHVLVQPFVGVKLEEWLYSVKRFSSNEITKYFLKSNEINPKRHLWQVESFDRIVRTAEELLCFRRYIWNNPIQLPSGTFTLRKMKWLDNKI